MVPVTKKKEKKIFRHGNSSGDSTFPESDMEVPFTGSKKKYVPILGYLGKKTKNSSGVLVLLKVFSMLLQRLNC